MTMMSKPAGGKIDVEKRAVTFDKYLYANAEDVWAALTDPNEVAKWFVPFRIEPRIGGPIAFIFEDHEATGTILNFEPPKLLEFTWRSKETKDSIVRMEITPDSDGCWLTLTHTLKDAAPVMSFARGWRIWLDRLGPYVSPEGGPVKDDIIYSSKNPSHILQRRATYPSPGTYPCGLAFDGGGVWYSDADSQTLTYLDMEGIAVREIPLPGLRAGLAFDGKYLWQVANNPKELVGIDREGNVKGRIKLQPPADQLGCGAEFHKGLLFLTVGQTNAPEVPGHIRVIDPRTGKLIRKIPICQGPGCLVLVGDDIWYANAHDGELVHIDQEGQVKDVFPIGGDPTGLAFDGKTFWINDYSTWRIDRYELMDTNL